MCQRAPRTVQLELRLVGGPRNSENVKLDFTIGVVDGDRGMPRGPIVFSVTRATVEIWGRFRSARRACGPAEGYFLGVGGTAAGAGGFSDMTCANSLMSSFARSGRSFGTVTWITA